MWLVVDVDDPVERLRRLGRAYLAFAAERPRRYRLLFDRRDVERDDRPRAGVRRESFDVLTDALQTCVDAGRSTSTDVLGDATSIWVSLHGFATLRAGVAQFPCRPRRSCSARSSTAWAASPNRPADREPADRGCRPGSSSDTAAPAPLERPRRVIVILHREDRMSRGTSCASTRR